MDNFETRERGEVIVKWQNKNLSIHQESSNLRRKPRLNMGEKKGKEKLVEVRAFVVATK